MKHPNKQFALDNCIFSSQKFGLIASSRLLAFGGGGTNTFQQFSTPGPEVVDVSKLDYRGIIFTPVKEQFYDSKSVVFPIYCL